MPSVKSDISDAILSRLGDLETAGKIKYKAFDKVRSQISDFKDYEFPAVQCYDVGQAIRHENLRIFVNWSVSVEIIMKSTTAGIVSQKDLWDLQYEIERKLWERPVNLGVSGVVDMRYTGSETDLHSLGNNIYFARLDLEVQFYQPLVDDC